MVQTNNDIYRNNVNSVSFLFRRIGSPVEWILWFQASGSIFSSILKLANTEDVIILKEGSF